MKNRHAASSTYQDGAVWHFCSDFYHCALAIGSCRTESAQVVLALSKQ